MLTQPHDTEAIGNMEKKTIFAIILCIAVWLIWQALFIEPIEPPVKKADGGQTESTETTAATGPENAEDGAVKERKQPPAERPQEKLLRMKTDLYEAVWSTRGASLKNFILSNYKERDENKKAEELEKEDLVSLPEEGKRPLAIRFHSEKTDFKLPEYTDWSVVEQTDSLISLRFTSPDENIPIITNLDEISTSESIMFLIGGFQHGDITIDLEDLKSYQTNINYLKIYDEVKPTWVIAAKLIHWLERNLLP